MPAHPHPSGITFINARLGGGEMTSLSIAGARIAALGAGPRRGDTVVDLEGDRVLPGLINAHDHLQLNSLPRPAFGRLYRNVREWISDVDACRRTDVEFAAGVAVGRDDRLLIGGVKNLLSGVTTVAHHDPLFPSLADPGFPTRVVRDYGWAHSLHVDGEEKVGNSYRTTPDRQPWIIHAAEGLDEAAGTEFERLEKLGCIGPNTLLVHGIALDGAQRTRLERAGAGLIWCPCSNLHLFGKTAEIAGLAARGLVALGTDSRLSGAGDLLDELRFAAGLDMVDGACLESLATSAGARLLRLRDRGQLRAGSLADILILPAQTPLGTARRSDVRLLLIDGLVRYGDRDCARRTAPGTKWVEILVDGRTKILDRRIAELVSRVQTGEIGLELPELPGRAA